VTVADNLYINDQQPAAVTVISLPETDTEYATAFGDSTAVEEIRDDTELRIDFSHSELYSNCIPVSCTVNGVALDCESWRDLLINIIEMFLSLSNPRIGDLFSQPLSQAGNRPLILTDKPDDTARQLSTGHWVCVSYNTVAIINLIGTLCDYCGTDPKDVIITYKPKPDIIEGQNNAPSDNSTYSVFAQQEIREAFREWLSEQHPDWSSKTLTSKCSDAYYIYNNDFGVSLDEALTTENGFFDAHSAMERYFTENIQVSNPVTKALYYMRSLTVLKEFFADCYPALLNISESNRYTVPLSVITTLFSDYTGGFRFDTTALRLLSNKSGVDIDSNMILALKKLMFHRSDDVYFLLDSVASAKTRMEIAAYAESMLEEFGCFEISLLYSKFAHRLNQRSINSDTAFEQFYERIANRSIRCVAAPKFTNRIARYNNINVGDTFGTIARRIISLTRYEFGGVISEEDLQNRFYAFSADLLAKIIKNYIGDDLLRVEINGIVCYQTLDTIGLPQDFSSTLNETLSRITELELNLTEEVIHTALSLVLGVNFKAEYNIPDQATFRRLIDFYYNAHPKREWKGGFFREVID